MSILRYAVAALCLAACSSGRVEQRPSPRPPAIPDSALGLHPGSVFDDDAPPSFVDEAADPGSSHRPARSWSGEPPVIPHSVADLLPIRPDSNACLDCHGDEGGDAPVVPASHRTDLRRSPHTAGAELVGARYICNSCHLARTDAPALVGNRAEP